MTQSKPLFLLVNDDGVRAPGLAALRQVASEFGDVIVVAPQLEKSGASHAISLVSPLRVQKFEDRVFGVSGTPADCVMFAVSELLSQKPDWVLSGINRGLNVGQDTLYSGTVAGALEGVLQGIPAMAFSLQGASHTRIDHYEVAAKVIRHFLTQRHEFIGEEPGAVNVNVPSCTEREIAGVQLSSLGHRFYDTCFQKGRDPRGQEYYWLGGGGHRHRDSVGSDCVAIEQNFVSYSFLKPDLTCAKSQQAWRQAGSREANFAESFSAGAWKQGPLS